MSSCRQFAYSCYIAGIICFPVITFRFGSNAISNNLSLQNRVCVMHGPVLLYVATGDSPLFLQYHTPQSTPGIYLISASFGGGGGLSSPSFGFGGGGRMVGGLIFGGPPHLL